MNRVLGCAKAMDNKIVYEANLSLFTVSEPILENTGAVILAHSYENLVFVPVIL